MLVVETIAKIRRDQLVEGKSIKAIARDRGVSPKHAQRGVNVARRSGVNVGCRFTPASP